MSLLVAGEMPDHRLRRVPGRVQSWLRRTRTSAIRALESGAVGRNHPRGRHAGPVGGPAGGGYQLTVLVGHLLDELGSTDRVQIALIAYRTGLAFLEVLASECSDCP